MFNELRTAVNRKLTELTINNDWMLFQTDVSKDKIWDLYLEGIPEEHNPIYKTNRVYDGNYDKSFIRTLGRIKFIHRSTREVTNIWDVKLSDDNFFKDVILDMYYEVMSADIVEPWLHYQYEHGYKTLGGFDHFYFTFAKDAANIINKSMISSLTGRYKTNNAVIYRSLEEISVSSLDTILELIDNNSIYRGKEHKKAVSNFKVYKTMYEYDANTLGSLGVNKSLWFFYFGLS